MQKYKYIETILLRKWSRDIKRIYECSRSRI